MSRFAFIVLLIISFHSEAQVTTYYNSNWKPADPTLASFYCVLTRTDTLWKSNCFYVNGNKLQSEGWYLDTNFKRRVGKFTWYDSSGQIIQTGNYLNEKPDGIWLSWYNTGVFKDSSIYKKGALVYSRSYTDSSKLFSTVDTDNNGKTIRRIFLNDGRLEQEGSLVNGLKEGIWKVYVPDLDLIQEVEFLRDSVISVTCHYSTAKKSKDCIYERDAEFRGGTRAWTEYLTKKLTKYASKHYDGMRSGKVVVRFIVDVDGTVINPKVVFSTDRLLNEIAISFIQESPKWKPAVRFNRNVKAYWEQPILFVKP